MDTEKSEVIRIVRQKYSVQIAIDQNRCRMWGISAVWWHDDKWCKTYR